MNRFFTKLFSKKGDAHSVACPALREELQSVGIDVETLVWTKSFVERYGPALRELADK